MSDLVDALYAVIEAAARVDWAAIQNAVTPGDDLADFVAAYETFSILCDSETLLALAEANAE